MFSLLVKAGGWAESRDSMPLIRSFEHTKDSIIEEFKVNSEIDFQALIGLPALFLKETFGNEDPVARVGRIIHAGVYGRGIYGTDISLEYVYDPSIPPVKNSKLKEFASELGIDDFEFRRTHWAIKNNDLFKALLRNIQPRRQLPKVFRIEDPEHVEPTLASAMMPFHLGFDSVYESIKKASSEVYLHCRRADDIWENPEIIQDIVSLIDHSRVIICDCTGRNPNVFYEIGIAHTLGREVILITQNEEDIPFDLRHLRFIKYLNNAQGLSDLEQRLESKLRDLVGA